MSRKTGIQGNTTDVTPETPETETETLPETVPDGVEVDQADPFAGLAPVISPAMVPLLTWDSIPASVRERVTANLARYQEGQAGPQAHRQVQPCANMAQADALCEAFKAAALAHPGGRVNVVARVGAVDAKTGGVKVTYWFTPRKRA